MLYSVGELASLVGVPRRTIRYYVEMGLLNAPEGHGRGSYYLPAHVTRLLEIQDYQRQGLTLGQIRRQLEFKGPGPKTGERGTAEQTEGADQDRTEQIIRKTSTSPGAAPRKSKARSSFVGRSQVIQPLVSGYELLVSEKRPPLGDEDLAALVTTLSILLTNREQEEAGQHLGSKKRYVIKRKLDS